jgi:hypothetical protein
MTRTAEQVLEDQQRQATAERSRRVVNTVTSSQGLSPLQARQERLWGWHDMRGHSQGKYVAPDARPENGSAPAAVRSPRSLFEGVSEEECHASPS